MDFVCVRVGSSCNTSQQNRIGLCKPIGLPRRLINKWMGYKFVVDSFNSVVSVCEARGLKK